MGNNSSGIRREYAYNQAKQACNIKYHAEGAKAEQIPFYAHCCPAACLEGLNRAKAFIYDKIGPEAEFDGPYNPRHNQ